MPRRKEVIKILIAKSKEKECVLLPNMVNRHGLVAGATGTGKTVTLRVIAENLSRIGVPCFMCDVKGDLSGIAASSDNPKIEERRKLLNINEENKAYPVLFWDLYKELGHPIRTSLDSFGDLLLSRLLDLTKAQTGILALGYKFCADNDAKIKDFLDVQNLLKYLADNAFDFKREYGNITYASVGAIQREIIRAKRQGVDMFFNYPVFDIADFFHQNQENYGVINILQADTLIKAPKLYSTFLLWLLSELYERLDEVGDLEKPRFVFFFDEAHLLFADIPKILLEKVEQVVRLIRSKGVGVYFITQNPLDIPDSVLGQLGNRVQHAMRAFTPRDRKTVRAIAETFRDNPGFRTSTAIMQLKTGEALVSFLGEDGDPLPVERALILPPQSRLEPLTHDEIKYLVTTSPLYGKYENEDPKREAPIIRIGEHGSSTGRAAEQFGRAVIRGMGSRVGNQLLRGIFNSFLRGGRGGLGR